MLKNKMSRAQYMRKVGKNKKLSKKQKEGLWKGYAKRTKQAVKPRGKPRTYGKGKFKAVRARIGPKRRWTHMYRTKGGNVRHIPEWAELGYKSFKDMIRLSSTKQGARVYVRRKEALDARRERAADKSSSRILRGKGVFTPNRRRRRRPRTQFTFDEWEKEMKANARRRKKTTKKKKRTTKKRPTRAQTAARKRNTKKAQAARRKKSTKRKATKRKATKRRTVKRATARRKATKRRTTKRKTTKRKATKRRAKRNARARRPARRRFFRNQAKSFTRDFGKVIKVGLVVGAGFVLQKVATKLLTSTGLMAKLPASVQSFANSIAGLAVASVGVLGAAKFVPGDSKMVGAGMGAAFLHTVLLDGLDAFGQPQLVSYLGDYTEAPGKAFGSYYEFSPHQRYPAMGEYYSTPVAGMGQYQQAAAGMGQYQQAAAGMGQAPRMSQAAAGVGEYLVQGANGIGEYEEVVPQYSAPEQIEEGISPDLSSAERALSVAEAAAGVGAYGDDKVPLVSSVYPTGQPEAIPDMPGGSRAGTFAGSNGVFGTSA